MTMVNRDNPVLEICFMMSGLRFEYEWMKIIIHPGILSLFLFKIYAS
jgi:hypothetical protein